MLYRNLFWEKINEIINIMIKIILKKFLNSDPKLSVGSCPQVY